ncbi:unnamed protein product [Paramecium pentaurelia]|uniref:Uncharacterized protein n=1 Tax=Paramecium pentaurelia TaxID=43138 RepID=A0A8S1WSC2_9CILI|nr:unnamed protein product [Paramecium pentaurelia]
MGNQKSTYKWYNSEKSDFSNVLAINHDNSVLVVGIREEIQIFKILHNKEYNVEIQLNKRKRNFLQSQLFNFKNLRHANFFLSGSEHLINIWAPDDQLMPYCWQSKYKIEWTQSIINCVIIHPNENLSIRGDNENVKFWQLQEQYVCQQIINEHKMPIIGLSISPDGRKIISIGADKNLQVMADSEKKFGKSF